MISVIKLYIESITKDLFRGELISSKILFSSLLREGFISTWHVYTRH